MYNYNYNYIYIPFYRFQNFGGSRLQRAPVLETRPCFPVLCNLGFEWLFKVKTIFENL